VTPETQGHLGKAHEHLAKARVILDRLQYADEAARCAYLAAFHAAQPLISERSGRTAKTYAGVHSQFNLLTKDDSRVDVELRHFLSDAFDLKTVADYETGPDAIVSRQEAEVSIATASRFIDRIVEILA
jgi:uncharacterized protein (UPF0332 family)